MPKRVHCPYCDRLFSKNEIDGHVQKCRTRQKKRPVTVKHNVLIVDGTNVAHYFSSTGTPHVRNILLALQSLYKSGFRPIIVVSAALIYRIDRPDVLDQLVMRKDVIKTRRGQNDDLVIIRLAQRFDADIVSNDRFLDWREKYPWLAERLHRFRMTPNAFLLE